MNKAVFLDRDGVINRTHFKMGKFRAPYNLSEFMFFDGVLEAVNRLKEIGFQVFAVTNQPDVKRGWVNKAAVDRLNQHVLESLKLDALRACFHDKEDNCSCRKPKPGMLIELASEFDIDLQNSYMVGDRKSDIEAGLSAGCRCIWIKSEASEEDVDSSLLLARCESLVEAVEVISQDFSSSSS